MDYSELKTITKTSNKKVNNMGGQILIDTDDSG